MALNQELKISNLIILANVFNPSALNQHWLISKGIIAEGDFLPQSFFAPNVVKIDTLEFNFLLLPDNFQIQFNSPDKTQAILNSVILPIIEKIGDVPILAAGFNLNWFVSETDKNSSELSRELFFNSNANILNNFNTSDAKFGIYASKDFNNCRLKMDVKPLNYKTADNPDFIEVIQFALNYHLDLQNKTVIKTLEDFIKEWEIYYLESLSLISTIK